MGPNSISSFINHGILKYFGILKFTVPLCPNFMNNKPFMLTLSYYRVKLTVCGSTRLASWFESHV